MTGITMSSNSNCEIVPSKHDVLLGRGGKICYHTGNEILRSVASYYSPLYMLATKKEKPLIASILVLCMHQLQPRGRFLKRDPASGRWVEESDDVAREKTSQCLRDAAVLIQKDKETQKGQQQPDLPAQAILDIQAMLQLASQSQEQQQPQQQPQQPSRNGTVEAAAAAKDEGLDGSTHLFSSVVEQVCVHPALFPSSLSPSFPTQNDTGEDRSVKQSCYRSQSVSCAKLAWSNDSGDSSLPVVVTSGHDNVKQWPSPKTLIPTSQHVNDQRSTISSSPHETFGNTAVSPLALSSTMMFEKNKRSFEYDDHCHTNSDYGHGSGKVNKRSSLSSSSLSSPHETIGDMAVSSWALSSTMMFEKNKRSLDSNDDDHHHNHHHNHMDSSNHGHGTMIHGSNKRPRTACELYYYPAHRTSSSHLVLVGNNMLDGPRFHDCYSGEYEYKYRKSTVTPAHDMESTDAWRPMTNAGSNNPTTEKDFDNDHDQGTDTDDDFDTRVHGICSPDVEDIVACDSAVLLSEKDFLDWERSFGNVCSS